MDARKNGDVSLKAPAATPRASKQNPLRYILVVHDRWMDGSKNHSAMARQGKARQVVRERGANGEEVGWLSSKGGRER